MVKKNLNNIKLIVCDLDNTIIDNEDTLDPVTINYINKIIAIGIRFVIVTGRNIERILPLVKQINPDYQDYVICGNGSGIFDMKTQRYIYQKFIAKQPVVNELFDLANIYNIEVVSFNNHNPSVHFTGSVQGDLLAYRKTQNNHTYEEYHHQLNEIYKLQIAGSREDLANYLHEIKHYNFNIFAFKFDNQKIEWTEICAVGVSKAAGVKMVSKICHIDLKNILAIGDNFNDLSMLQLAKTGIIINNKTIAKDYPCLISWSTLVNKTVFLLYNWLNKDVDQ